MTRKLAFRLLATVSIVAIGVSETAQAQPPKVRPIDATQVLEAIDRGVAYLKREQRGGRWNDMASYEGGVTALCTLALLNSGVPADDPSVSRALDYLRGIIPEKTYVVALQTMVLCAAQPQKDMLRINRNVRW